MSRALDVLGLAAVVMVHATKCRLAMREKNSEGMLKWHRDGTTIVLRS
jgi:hypothetical protein